MSAANSIIALQKSKCQLNSLIIRCMKRLGYSKRIQAIKSSLFALVSDSALWARRIKFQIDWILRITQNTPEITICLMINLNCVCPTAPKILVSKKDGCLFLKLVNNMTDIEVNDSSMFYSSLYGGIDEEANDDKLSNEEVKEDAVECLISHRFKPEQNLNLA